jgi:hypothetical protein
MLQKNLCGSFFVLTVCVRRPDAIPEGTCVSYTGKMDEQRKEGFSRDQQRRRATPDKSAFLLSDFHGIPPNNFYLCLKDNHSISNPCIRNSPVGVLLIRKMEKNDYFQV